MKHVRTAVLALAAFLMPSAAALAHEGHAATVGELVSVAADGFEIKTDDGKIVAVKFTDKTVFEKDKKPVDKTHLKKGDRVAVTLGKDAAGATLATNVRLGLPAAKPKEPAKPVA